MEILTEPSIDEAKDLIQKGIEKHKVLLIVGRCSVDYKGRASSKLEPGERIVIIKEDRALLVHRSTGYDPVNYMPGGEVVFHVALTKAKEEDSQRNISVNWQPAGSIFHASVTRNVLSIRAIRRKPREALKIYFDKIYLVCALSIVDEGRFYLHASEEDMQKAILIEPSLVEKGLKLITYEKKVEPGFLDVYGVDEDGRMVIIEIKRKTAGKEAALQLARYVESVKKSTNREVRGVLVAPNTAKGVQKLLTTLGLDFRRLDPKKCAEILRRSETKELSEFL